MIEEHDASSAPMPDSTILPDWAFDEFVEELERPMPERAERLIAMQPDWAD